MFTLQKIHIVRKFFFKEPTSLTIEENAQISDIPKEFKELIEKVSSKTAETLASKDSLEAELDKFKIRGLKEFFLRYPNAWQDLKRKLHRHRSMESGGKWRIEKKDEVEILSLFLRKGREKDTGSNIFRLAHKEILENNRLIKEIGSEPSLLDSSYLDIINLQEDKRLSTIQNIIFRGLKDNSPFKGEFNIGERFKGVYPYIVQYLSSVYSIPFSDELQKADSIEGLSTLLVNMIWPKSGNRKGIEAKNAWMITKAFHAWGGVPEIIEQHESITGLMQELPNKLMNAGIQYTPGKIRKEGGAQIFTGKGSVSFDDDGKKFYFDIEYRAKGIESTLTKLFADEDYTNFDAMRDILGIAVILPDGTNPEDKINIISRFSRIMSNRGYIYKEKGFLSGTDSRKAIQKLRSGEKKPIGVSKGRDSYTSNDFINGSLSGFTTLGHEDYAHAIGTEVQFFEERHANWWKNEHPEYHPRRIIQSWSRGGGFTTPRQIAMSYVENLDNSNLPYIKDAFTRAVKSEMLIPYKIGDDNQLLFTTQGTHEAFKERFSSGTIEQIDGKNLENVIEFMNVIIDREHYHKSTTAHNDKN